MPGFLQTDRILLLLDNSFLIKDFNGHWNGYCLATHLVEAGEACCLATSLMVLPPQRSTVLLDTYLNKAITL